MVSGRVLRSPLEVGPVSATYGTSVFASEIAGA